MGQEPSAPGEWAWRSGAHRAARSPGGAGRHCEAPSVAHSRVFPPWPVAPRQPRPVFAVSRQPTVFCKYTCTSLNDVSAIPPPAGRPWRRSAPGPSPRSSGKDKRAVGPPQPAWISTSQDPGRGNPRGQVEDEGFCEDCRGLLQARLKEWKGQGGGVRVLGPAGVSWGDGEVAVGPVGFVTPKRAQEVAKWQSRARACQTLWSPGYGAAPQQTPDGKGRRNKSRLPARRSPSAAPGQPPTSGSSSSKCRNFSQALNPAGHKHGGSPPAGVAAPGSWCCT